MAHQEKFISDVKVEASIGIPYYAIYDMKKKEKFLLDWIRDFNVFIRDHRSQDMINLEIIPVLSKVCSDCKKEWETMIDDNGKYACANCGSLIEDEAVKTT